MLYKMLEPEEAKLKVIADEASGDAGFLEGYASVFGNVDLGSEVVVKGAFAKTIKERLKKGMIKLYDSHLVHQGTDALIGLVEDASEDDYGLKFRARFSSVKRAQDIRTKIKEGILNALSFGYEVIKSDPDQGGKTRLLKELKLYEISVVPWGMNPKAAIESVKGEEGEVPKQKTQEEEEAAALAQLAEEERLQKINEAVALEEAAKNSPIAAACKAYRAQIQAMTLKQAIVLQTAAMRGKA